jgi:DNA-binding NarL/FixJ family response regulator
MSVWWPGVQALDQPGAGSGIRMARPPVAWDDPRVSTKVPIVDDHASLARAVLAAGGFQVVGEAADAQSALAAARELRPECVLSDVQLGDVDGFAVAEALADDGDGPVVVLTSGRDPRDIEPVVGASAARGFIPEERLSAAGLGELLR